MENPAEALAQVIAVARQAGQEILSYYHGQSAAVRIKSDHTPVTDADMAAHQCICAGLQAFSSLPIVSEEGGRVATPLSVPTYWLVDPLDGTKEFIARSDEFTVNIALIHHGVAILGVVYAPIFDLLYYAARGSGAFKITANAGPTPLHTRPFRAERFTYLVSRRHDQTSLGVFKASWPGCTITPLGSSLKFCKIAEGAADLYIRRGPTSEWDTAASHCVLAEAGGKLVTGAGRPLVYNKDTLINPEFLACGDAALDVQAFLPVLSY